MTRYTQPVKVGEEITVEVQNIGEKGDGIARHEGFVIIVPKGQIECTYNVKITKVFNKFAIGEITDTIDTPTEKESGVKNCAM